MKSFLHGVLIVIYTLLLCLLFNIAADEIDRINKIQDRLNALDERVFGVEMEVRGCAP